MCACVYVCMCVCMWPTVVLTALFAALTGLLRFYPPFSTHAGGAKVLDGIGKNLKITESHLWPSRTVLRYYGNVSSR